MSDLDEIMAKVRADRDAALAVLDETVQTAAAEIAASVAQGNAYKTEMEDIDETIERLRRRRAELEVLSPEHTNAERRLRLQTYARVNKLCNLGEVETADRLAKAVEVVYGKDHPAIAHALRVGGRLLRVTKTQYRPFLCHGYARLLQAGLWCGGHTDIAHPRVGLVAGLFHIVVPILVQGRKDVCNVPIDGLVELTPNGYVPMAQAYIGEEDIAAGIKGFFGSTKVEPGETEAIRNALAYADYTSQECDALFAGLNN